MEYVEVLMCGNIRDPQVGQQYMLVWCIDIQLLYSLIMILIIEVA